MKNEPNNESMLLKFQAIVEKQEESKEKVHSHFAMCFECDEEGHPIGQLVKMDASPIKALGMVEQAMFELKSIKKRIKASMDNRKNNDENPDSIKAAVMSVAADYKERIEQAISNGDAAALRILKEEIKQEVSKRTGISIPKDDSDDETPFNLDDFKNM